MAVSLNTALGAFPITALAGTAYVPLAGGTMTGALTIASGTLTASAPALNISQTWNAGATAFTGALIDITNTASGDASRALDVRIAGSSIFSVRPDGYAIASAGMFVGLGGLNGLWDSVGPHVKSTGAYSWAQSANATDTSDLYLYRDAAATLAQRNGTTQQIFRLYNSYTDSSNFERLTLTGVAGTSVNITAETLGTGADNIDIVLTPAGTGRVVIGNVGIYPSSGLVQVAQVDSSIYGSSLQLKAYTSEDVIFYEGSTVIGRFLAGGGLQLSERTAPSAPAGDSVRIYAEDNGSGKTRLMALFATGAAQQIAIEP